MEQTDLLTDDQPFATLSSGVIAGTWCEDGVWTGGVFALDGVRLVTLEPASAVGSFGGRQLLVPLPGDRILSTRTAPSTMRGRAASRHARGRTPELR